MWPEASSEELAPLAASRVHLLAFMSLHSCIRLATPEDAPEVARLLHVDDVGGLPLAELGNHYLLVVDAPEGGLAAAAIVRLETPRATLRVLARARPDDDDLAARVIDYVEQMHRARPSASATLRTH